MPPSTLYDLSQYDLDKVTHDLEAIRAANPQRGDMEHLNGVVHLGPEGAIAFKDVHDKEFWVAGHLPGRPLLPGVIMIEAAAQVASFYTKLQQKWDGFIGFGGVDAVKFRQAVTPGCRLYILVKLIRARHGRINCDAQGLVNGNIVFEGQITGTRV